MPKADPMTRDSRFEPHPQRPSRLMVLAWDAQMVWVVRQIERWSPTFAELPRDAELLRLIARSIRRLDTEVKALGLFIGAGRGSRSFASHSEIVAMDEQIASLLEATRHLNRTMMGSIRPSIHRQSSSEGLHTEGLLPGGDEVGP